MFVEDTYRKREQSYSAAGIYSQVYCKRMEYKISMVFSSENTYPFNYLTEESLISANGTCASDVELMAVSLILEADVYVATNDCMLEGSLFKAFSGACLELLSIINIYIIT